MDVIVRIRAGPRCDRPNPGKDFFQQRIIGVGLIQSSGAAKTRYHRVAQAIQSL